jgi:hypothetical protein
MSLDTVRPNGTLVEIYDPPSRLLISLRFNAVRKLDFVCEVQLLDRSIEHEDQDSRCCGDITGEQSEDSSSAIFCLARPGSFRCGTRHE